MIHYVDGRPRATAPSNGHSGTGLPGRQWRPLSGAPKAFRGVHIYGVENISAVRMKSMPSTPNEATTTVRVVACATPSGVAFDS